MSMNFSRPDVDIEVTNRESVLRLLETAIPASQIANGKLVRHISGLYFQNIPRHPVSGLAVFPFEQAEERGFFKIDLLSCPHPYVGITSMAELRALLAQPIDWSWFTNIDFVSLLFHVHNMAEVVTRYAPNSIPDLACMVAIKMPAKKHLIGQSWDTIRQQIWTKPVDKVKWFKKSHSIAYSLAVTLDAKVKINDYSRSAL